MQQPISAGTVISHRYQIQKKIQSNTFNSCYLAEDAENSNRLVMLSLPRIELLILPDFMPTFEKVCVKLIRTPFQGLLKVLGHGDYHAHPYAVLQYVTDETLEHVLARKRISSTKVDMDSVLDWATPLASTLDELHEFGYVHGSLKPSSVHIGSQKILMGDFITEYTLQLMGKFKNGITTLNVDEYLSPEYLKSSYTANYDQYLLATMVYESLAGKVPFARTKGGEDYRMQVATHVSPLLTAHRPELKAVSDVLAKAMKRKPTDRYKSCRAFISQLQEAQAAEPPKPPPQKRVVITTPFSDEPEEEDEAIVTSIRASKQRSGSKKGLVWLGVLFVTGGAAAYTAVNYPQYFGLDAQKDAAPVVVPVSIALSPALAPAVTESVSTDVKVETLTDVIPNVDIAPVLPKEVVSEKETTKQVEAPLPKTIEKEVLGDKALDDLHRVVAKALDTGSEDFKATTVAKESKAVVQSDLDKAVTLALLNGQDAFAKKTAVEKVDVIDSTDSVTFAEKVEPASSAVKPVDEDKVSESEVVNNTPIVTSEAQETGVAVDESLDSSVTQETVEPASVSIEEAKILAQAGVSAPVEKAPAVPAVEVKAPVDPLVEMQEKRKKLQVLKQQKIARIKSITDDCTIGGKILKQASLGNLAYVKNCLSVGVSANLTQGNGWSLLHVAARGGSLNLCKLLLAKGAVVNAKAPNGQTALDMAIALRKDRVAAYLITRGAK